MRGMRALGKYGTSIHPASDGGVKSGMTDLTAGYVDLQVQFSPVTVSCRAIPVHIQSVASPRAGKPKGALVLDGRGIGSDKSSRRQCAQAQDVDEKAPIPELCVQRLRRAHVRADRKTESPFIWL